MDLSLVNLFSFVDRAAGPSVAGFGVWLIVKANSFLGLTAKSQAQDNLDQAMQHGETLLVEWWKSLESHNTTVTVPDNTLTEIASKVIALAPGAEQLLGVTPESLAPVLQSKLAQWLHWQQMPGATATVVNVQPGTQITSSTDAAPPIAPAAA